MYLDMGVPQDLIDGYLKDFEHLPGGVHRDHVELLRRTILTVIQSVWDEPVLAQNPDYHEDLRKVLAMREALCTLGIFYDS